MTVPRVDPQFKQGQTVHRSQEIVRKSERQKNIKSEKQKDRNTYPSWFFFAKSWKNVILCDISAITVIFLGVRGEGFFFFFQTLLSLKLLLRFTNKKIRFYHISNDFFNIPGGRTKTRKKSDC